MDDLPNGFDDASTDVQQQILETYRSSELTAEIAAELGIDAPRSGQLGKDHKAAILLALRQ